MCKAWQLIFSCFSLCALVKRCFRDRIKLGNVLFKALTDLVFELIFILICSQNIPPLPVLRQIFLRVVDGYRAVRYGGDHLPQRLGAHIARGEHAGEVGAGGFVCHDIAGFVQQLLASEQLRRRGTSHTDEHAVTGKVAFRAGVDVFCLLYTSDAADD